MKTEKTEKKPSKKDDKKKVVKKTAKKTEKKSVKVLKTKVIKEEKPKSDLKNTILKKIKSINYREDGYVKEKTIKSQIILHNSNSGPMYRTDTETYLNDKNKKSVNIFIEKDGTPTQLFSSSYWGHNLEIPGYFVREQGFTDVAERNLSLNQSSISIELDNYGGLYKLDDNHYRTLLGKLLVIDDKDVAYYDYPYNGYNYYDPYTKEQLETLEQLLEYWSESYDITLEYKGIEMFEVSKKALIGEPGVWVNSSYMGTEFNCHPDNNLTRLLNLIGKK